MSRKNAAIAILLILATLAYARLPMTFTKGRRALEEGRYADAAELFRETLKARGVQARDEMRIRRSLVEAYIGLQEWEAAEEQLNRLIESSRRPQMKERLEELRDIVAAPEDSAVYVRNLGPGVNTRHEELAPVISPDEQTLYFIREGDPAGEGKQDIFFSQRQGENWTEARSVGPPLNTPGHDGILSISPDGTTALLAGVYQGRGVKTNGYSLANLRGGRWTDPRAMDIKDYYNNNNLTSAFLSSSGKVLLLALERNDSYGDLDIYASFLNPDGSWTAPANLGPQINSSGTDGTPFLASDDKTLYFSSDGRIGLGSQDMYKAERQDDSWKKWSRPENLGKQVNSAGWDAYYTIPAEGNVAYFVSGAEGGRGLSDIWMIHLPQKARPQAVVTVSGKVMEPDSTPVGADISWEKLSTGENMGIAASNDVTGEYMIILPVGESYGYVAQKEGYLPSSANLNLTDATEYDEIHHDIIITPMERGAQTVLNNIFFDFDEATLRPESGSELQRVADFMQKHGSLRVEISGHTDSVGTASYNKNLSRERAQAVADWLIEAGVDSSRLEVVGYGESQPVADNATEEGRQKNRRVVFEILDL